MRWLHISDIHFDPEGDGSSTEQLRDELPSYLQQFDKVDEVFATGDFRNASYQSDTEEVATAAATFLRELAASIGVDNPEHIHIVPGNHDLTRQDKRELGKIRREYDVVDGVFKNKEYLLERFSFFKRVVRHLHPNGSIWSDNLQPLHPYCCFGDYNLLYMNTAIACGSDDERGKLVIGNKDLLSTLKKIKTENSGAPTIALAHHGLEHFSTDEQETIEQLFRSYPVRLYLRGDSHKPWYRKINETEEITMGCIKQGKGVRAAFSIGELRPDGSFPFLTHSWDPAMGTWGLYDHFNRKFKTLSQNRVEDDRVKDNYLKTRY